MKTRSRQKPMVFIDDLAVLEFTVAGLDYYDYHQRVVRVGDIIELVPEPTNQFDSSAVKVMTNDGHQLGYVRADVNIGVARLITRGPWTATVMNIWHPLGLTVKLVVQVGEALND
jgi:hypothetical protein